MNNAYTYVMTLKYPHLISISTSLISFYCYYNSIVKEKMSSITENGPFKIRSLALEHTLT